MTIRKQTINEVSVSVELSENEYVTAVQTGLHRNVGHSESTPINKEGGGAQSHIEGSIGEMMVCKLFGIKEQFDNYPHVRSGDNMPDFWLNHSLPVDVKAVTHNDPWLLVKKTKVENGTSQVYILVSLDGGGGDTPVGNTGKVVGYMDSDVLQRDFSPVREPRSKLNYRADWRCINSIDKLINGE